MEEGGKDNSSQKLESLAFGFSNSHSLDPCCWTFHSRKFSWFQDGANLIKSKSKNLAIVNRPLLWYLFNSLQILAIYFSEIIWGIAFNLWPINPSHQPSGCSRNLCNLSLDIHWPNRHPVPGSVLAKRLRRMVKHRPFYTFLSGGGKARCNTMMWTCWRQSSSPTFHNQIIQICDLLILNFKLHGGFWWPWGRDAIEKHLNCCSVANGRCLGGILLVDSRRLIQNDDKGNSWYIGLERGWRHQHSWLCVQWYASPLTNWLINVCLQSILQSFLGC